MEEGEAGVNLEERKIVTVTLNFKPDIEAGLLAQAQASGMTVEEYLLSMVEGVVLPATQKARVVD